MPTTALPNDATWRPWADLPLDLLSDISRRLHAATDYASFHTACAPWRDALPPPTAAGPAAAAQPPPLISLFGTGDGW
ncbi:unnamed protein product [Urochloa humidicola]